MKCFSVFLYHIFDKAYTICGSGAQDQSLKIVSTENSESFIEISKSTADINKFIIFQCSTFGDSYVPYCIAFSQSDR